MIDVVKSNISWILDVFTIIFSTVSTTIIILTYVKSKETFLQPLRSEVVKKQTELLSELLTALSSYGNLAFQLDYPGLCVLNTYKYLTMYGYILKNQEQIKKETDEMHAGMIICSDDKMLRDIEVVQTFAKEKEDPQEEALKLGKERYEEAKKGNVTIDYIFITKQHDGYIAKLASFVDDPFMPASIARKIKDLLEEISVNRAVILKKVLKSFIGTMINDTDKTKNVSGIGLYNEFNHVRISHNKKYTELREEIRKYLRIDSMP